jgi:uncharacterized membrane protein YgdD (TMEM256/DUF423 family)
MDRFRSDPMTKTQSLRTGVVANISRLNVWLLVAALLGGFSVALGAFGAHRLESRLKEPDGSITAVAQRKVANWETAARYQMVHALAILAIGCLLNQRRSALLQASAAAMMAGTLIFSGCLYALVLSGQRFLGAVVPIGGILMIVGWALLFVAVVRQNTVDPR